MANVTSEDVPSPLVLKPPQEWVGNDGLWSTFEFSLGTPAQKFAILPDTENIQHSIPNKWGCNETDGDISGCGMKRGAFDFNGTSSNGYDWEASSSWINLLDELTGYSPEMESQEWAYQSLESIQLQGADDTVSLANQSFFEVDGMSPFVGLLSLVLESLEFQCKDSVATGCATIGSRTQPSLMQALRRENYIPSLSYAYTAGASYNSELVLGSLIIGGYDASRFKPTANEVSFPFGAEGKSGKNLTVGLQSITSADTSGKNETLLGNDEQILVHIDSSVPYIYLPRSVCDEIQDAYDLTYDNDTDLYIIDDDAFSNLELKKPTFNFTFGNGPADDQTVTISIPWNAMNLKASWPTYDEATPYIPIRRPVDDSDDSRPYKFGRAFLQEAYLIVNYEASNFSIHQTWFQSPAAEPDIVPIVSSENNPASTSEDPDNPSPSPLSSAISSKGDKLSGGQIAGITIGIIAIVALLGAFLLWFFRRRRQTLSKPNAFDDQPEIVNTTKDNGNGSRVPMLHATYAEDDSARRPYSDVMQSPDPAAVRSRASEEVYRELGGNMGPSPVSNFDARPPAMARLSLTPGVAQ